MSNQITLPRVVDINEHKKLAGGRINFSIEQAKKLVDKLRQEGRNIALNDLIEMQQKYPQAGLAELAAKLIARNEQPSSAVADPHIFYNPLLTKIVFVDAAALKAQDIYSRTNEEDSQFLKLKETKIEEEKTDTKRETLKRLANLEVARKAGEVNQEEIERAKYQNNFLVRA